MKAKHYSLSLLAFALFALTGCNQTITNLTSSQIPQNPSGIYTLTTHTQVPVDHLVADSVKVYIEIEEAQHEMQPSPSGGDLYEYEYAMPSDRAEAKYYFTINYTTLENGLKQDHTTTSQLYTLSIVNRYVITMEATRGLVGSSIPVVGRGFSQFDSVVIGGIEAPTTYESPNSLAFAVPPLAAGQDYEVDLHSGSNVFPMGTFHVDVANLTVTPESVEVASGDSALLVINMGQKAPEGGVPVDVKTDIPASVIMAPVTIPGGSPTVTVKVKGGDAGQGSLHLNAPGFNEVIVPITVSPAAAPEPAPEPTPAPAPAPVHMGS